MSKKQLILTRFRQICMHLSLSKTYKAPKKKAPKKIAQCRTFSTTTPQSLMAVGTFSTNKKKARKRTTIKKIFFFAASLNCSYRFQRRIYQFIVLYKKYVVQFTVVIEINVQKSEGQRKLYKMYSSHVQYCTCTILSRKLLHSCLVLYILESEEEVEDYNYTPLKVTLFLYSTVYSRIRRGSGGL